jgi:folate-binding protein YgfZ
MTGYDAVKKTTGVIDRSGEARFRVAGPDRVSWLQGLLTNDIAALTPGTGCYAAYLTPQGRMLADVRVLHRGETLLLDVPAAQREAVFERLTTFIIMEDVTLEDVTDSIARVEVHGPRAFDTLSACVSFASDQVQGQDTERARTLEEHANVTAKFAAHDVVIAGSREAGAFGFDVYVPRSAKDDLYAALRAAGAAEIDAEAWHTLRVEAGRPLFGVDMTTDTIPLEAGIEDRAISFTKGCYVGQEIIIRVMHRGHGRVARKLVGLQPEARGVAPAAQTAPTAPTAAAIETGAPIQSAAADREIGHVTSAAYSPALDRWIAMGYVHRDFIEPGTSVTIGAAAPHTIATIVALPFVQPPR